MKSVFSEGKEAKSIYANPYWKSYPNHSSVEDESKARHWVDGYLSKFTLERENEATS